MSEINQKIIFLYLGSASNSQESDDSFEGLSDYKEDIEDNDITKIQLPKMKL